MALIEVSVPSARAARQPVALRWVFPTLSFAIDVILINLAFASAYWLRYDARLGGSITRPQFNVPYHEWVPFELLITLVLIPLLLLSGIYRRRLGLEWLGQVFAVARVTTVGMALSIIITLFLQHLVELNQYSRGVLVYTWLLIIIYCAFVRALIQMAMVQLLRRGWH